MVNVLDGELVVDLELRELHEEMGKGEGEKAPKVPSQFYTEYSTDVEYLKSSQTVLEASVYGEEEGEELVVDTTGFLERWEKFRGDTKWPDRMQFMHMEFLKKLNYDVKFQQIVSIVRMSSPLLSILYPFLIILIPFVLFTLFGAFAGVTFWEFFARVCGLGEGINFRSFWRICGFTVMYIVQSVENLQQVIKYMNNLNETHSFVREVYSNASQMCGKIKNFAGSVAGLKVNSFFKDKATAMLSKVEKYIRQSRELRKVTMLCCGTRVLGFGYVPDVNIIGELLVAAYKIHQEDEWDTIIRDLVGYYEYIHHMGRLHKLVRAGKLQKARFEEKEDNGEVMMFDAKYPFAVLRGEEGIVPNDFNPERNQIITGPNASGKTTYMKSAMMNLILIQQIGFGFFESAYVPQLYDRFHCYMNIPDTSARDSLFQAEARRCQQIIHHVQLTKEKRHFAIFDELYSGTNPTDATDASVAFIRYVHEEFGDNFRFLLTTHFHRVCDAPGVTECAELKMTEVDDSGNFLYRVSNGVSTATSAVKILKELNFPERVISLLT